MDSPRDCNRCLVYLEHQFLPGQNHRRRKAEFLRNLRLDLNVILIMGEKNDLKAALSKKLDYPTDRSMTAGENFLM
jgi:hypothetical protein